MAAVAQPKLSSNDVVFSSGNWMVVRTTRARSDAVRCSGFYKSERTVQLTPDSMIIKAAYVQQIGVRFGDELSLPVRPPTEPERTALRLQGMPEALANIKAGCPAAGAGAGAQSCSDPLRARMKAAGVTEDQVLKICR